MKTWRIFVWLCPLLVACDRGSWSALLQSPEEQLQHRSEAIEDSVLTRLQETHAGARGITWNKTALDVADDWLLMSTTNLWQAPPEARPAANPCVVSDPNCQPQFTRAYCAVDSECGQGLTCAPLLATVYRLGDEPARVCQYPSDHLIDKLYTMVTQAEQQIDLASLSAPAVRFHEALVNALSIVSQQHENVRVRILYSGESAANLNIFQPPKNYTERLRRDIASHHGRLQNLHFNVAWLSSATSLSWTHVKTIVIDEKLAMQGGHNFWDKDYLGLTPVQDLSMTYDGQAIEDTTAFVDLLWNAVPPAWFYAPDGEQHFPPFLGSLPPATGGAVSAVSMGRMGVYGDNSSDDGLAALIDSAQSEILIAQQDIFAYSTLFGKSFVASNLFRAALRGVKIAIIQSNKDGLNYGMIPADKAIKVFRQDFVAFVKAAKIPLPANQRAEEFFCNAVFYAPLRYSPEWSTWSNNGPLSLHSKLIVADRAAFYLGSHNIYPANLQEFGMVIFDPARTAEVLEKFWEPMYAASRSARSICL